MCVTIIIKFCLTTLILSQYNRRKKFSNFTFQKCYFCQYFVGTIWHAGRHFQHLLRICMLGVCCIRKWYPKFYFTLFYVQNIYFVYIHIQVKCLSKLTVYYTCRGRAMLVSMGFGLARVYIRFCCKLFNNLSPCCSFFHLLFPHHAVEHPDQQMLAFIGVHLHEWK